MHETMLQPPTGREVAAIWEANLADFEDTDAVMVEAEDVPIIAEAPNA